MTLPSSDRQYPLSYVFIVTYGRSGSTALQAVLNSLDGYLIRGENMGALYGLYQSSKALVDTKKEEKRLGKNVTDPWFGAYRLNPEAYQKSLIDLFTDKIIAPHAMTRVCGFKEIRYLFDQATLIPYLEFMLEAFSPVKIIFNTRPHEEVVKSRWWATMDREEIISSFVEAEAAFTQINQRYPDQTFMMDHSKWSKSAEAFKPLMTFLGEPFDQSKIESILSHPLHH